MKSSKGVRRKVNHLIHFMNRFLPAQERIELVPVISFQTELELEIVLRQYLRAIYDGYAEWHDGLGEGDPEYKTSRTRIAEIEAQYGKRLNEYLKPYEGIDPVTVSSHHEWHRARVLLERTYGRRSNY